MNFTLHWFDPAEFLKAAQQPVFLFARPFIGGKSAVKTYGAAAARTGEFWTPVGPINADKIDWSETVRGDSVRIPVTAYTTTEPASSMLVACAFELGMRAGCDLMSRYRKQPADVLLVVGNKCAKLATGYRYYLGLTIKVL